MHNSKDEDRKVLNDPGAKGLRPGSDLRGNALKPAEKKPSETEKSRK